MIIVGDPRRIQDTAGFDRLEFHDDFSDDRAAGAVIGTLSVSGHKRLGVDVEKVLSVDNGALRIAPLIQAGFGRAVLSFGPFKRSTGLAFAVNILNGHNTAQAEPLLEPFRVRIIRWFIGSEVDPKWRRFIQWLLSGRIRRTLRQFRWWKRTAQNSDPVPRLDENLAVGWFPSAIVKDPRREGSTFVMHALGPENGELWAGGERRRTRSLRGVQNLPLYLVAVVREEGMVYYVSSVEGVPGIASYPHLRPVAVEHGPIPEELYLGIQPGVLGQIGFRMDTRIRGVRVGHAGGYDSWYGGAHCADRLVGDGNLSGTTAEVGGNWQDIRGEALRYPGGATGLTPGTMAILDPGSSTGLIHAEAVPGNGALTRIGLAWRFLDEQNHWRFEINASESAIVVVSGGERQVVAWKEMPCSAGNRIFRIQVLDDGRNVMAFIEGEPVADAWIADTRFEGATGVGILLDGAEEGKGAIFSFEAHPRSIEIPKALSMESPWFRRGTRLVVADDFAGKPGDIDGRTTPVGELHWSREIGRGVIEATGSGAARIRGSVIDPCPGRTAYCVDWANSEFADLEATIVLPGTQRGQKQHCTAGFILYQDPGNYVTLNIWRGDSYAGGSISTFFKFGGFEDIYDAIWTNVGDRVYYGRPARLRLCCDGERYLAFVNEEPVLYRAFRDVYANVERLRIRKVGLIANWEWGRDTGSTFERFEARA